MGTNTGPPRKKRGHFANIRRRVRRNKDGTKTLYWEGRPYQKDSLGVVKRTSVYASTFDEVKAKIREVESRRVGSFAAQRQRLGAYLDEWLSRGKMKWATKTYQIYESVTRLYIKPHIGGVPLGYLSRIHIDRLIGGKLSGVGPGAKEKVYKVLRYSLQAAIRSRYILSNPCDTDLRPRHEFRRFRVLTLDESRRLLEATRGTECYEIMLLALTTGMRQGEILALQWRDVDLDRATITVQATLDFDASGLAIRKSPKCGKLRIIDLPATTLDALRARQLTQRPKSEWIFTDKNGDPLHKEGMLRYQFRRALIAVELATEEESFVRFHDLRHTHATQLLAAGCNVKVVQERLGHASAKMTLDVYGHFVTSLQKEAAAATDAMYRTQTVRGTNGGTPNTSAVEQTQVA